MPPYTSPYVIQPSDIDSNGHVNYAAHIDAAGNVRYHFFAEHGFTPEKFAELGMGPIYTAIHAQFMREVLMGETVTITYTLSGLSPQGGRWKVHHDVLKQNGKPADVADKNHNRGINTGVLFL